MEIKKKKRSPETFMYRITDQHGTMSPADRYTHDRVVGKGYHDRDLVVVTIRKPRSLWQHKRAHIFGRIVGENIPRFDIYVSKQSGKVDAHQVLKCLQVEADIYCEHMLIMVPNVGLVDSRIPIRVSFDSMDQGEFEEFYSKLCEHVARVYWPGLTQEQIEQMTQLMPE